MNIEESHKKADRDQKYTKMALNWYGWGSPVGLGLFLVAVGVLIFLTKM